MLKRKESSDTEFVEEGKSFFFISASGGTGSRETQLRSYKWCWWHRKHLQIQSLFMLCFLNPQPPLNINQTHKNSQRAAFLPALLFLSLSFHILLTWQKKHILLSWNHTFLAPRGNMAYALLCIAKQVHGMCVLFRLSSTLSGWTVLYKRLLSLAIFFCVTRSDRQKR